MDYFKGGVGNFMGKVILFGIFFSVVGTVLVLFVTTPTYTHNPDIVGAVADGVRKLDSLMDSASGLVNALVGRTTAVVKAVATRMDDGNQAIGDNANAPIVIDE